VSRCICARLGVPLPGKEVKNGIPVSTPHHFKEYTRLFSSAKNSYWRTLNSLKEENWGLTSHGRCYAAVESSSDAFRWAN